VSGSLSGPIIPGKLSFYSSGRYKRDGGYLFGQRFFVPESFVWNPLTNNYEMIPASNTAYWDSLNTHFGSLPPDSQLVRMNWSEQLSGQTKLSWRMTPVLKLAYNFIGSKTSSQSYSQFYKWNPDGRTTNYTIKASHIFRIDFSLNSSTYFNAMVSRSENHFKRNLSNHFNFSFDDVPGSTIYNVDPSIDNFTPTYNFAVGGESMSIYDRKSIVTTYKFEGTSQLNRFHHAKAGVGIVGRQRSHSRMSPSYWLISPDSGHSLPILSLLHKMIPMDLKVEIRSNMLPISRIKLNLMI